VNGLLNHCSAPCAVNKSELEQPDSAVAAATSAAAVHPALLLL
jgi:hypothetical protein